MRAVKMVLPILVHVAAASCVTGSARSSAEVGGSITTDAAVFASLSPVADHHKHLISPAAALLDSDVALPAVTLPADLAELLRTREQHWNKAPALEQLYAPGALVLEDQRPEWLRGANMAASHMSRAFARPHRITPVAFGKSGSAAYIAGYYSRDTETGVRHFGHTLIALSKDRDGRWLIVAELPSFPGVVVSRPLTAETLIAELDAVGTRRAVVLSVAYWFGSALRQEPIPDEEQKVRAENSWVAEEVAKYPDRLVGFCSFNPLKAYALAELERCASDQRLAGLKLHFGNSGVDVRDESHAAAVRRVFEAANARGMPIVVHLWTSPEYEVEGGQHARAFLERVLPGAPDVVVQIAHTAGGGRSTDSAFVVFAQAIERGDPRTRNVYFDVATLVGGQSDAGLRRDVMRMRQIGLERFLWGSDTSPPNAVAGEAWAMFRARVPLTEAEMRKLANNVAPYLR